MKRRLLSMFLAIVMVVGMMPGITLTASAATVTNAADLQTAVSAGGTVILGGEIDLGSTVLTFPDNTPVTIDLNGNTLTKSSSGYVLELDAGDDVTITGNGTVSKAGGWYFFENDSGYLKIEGGTYSKSGYDLVYMSGSSVTEITDGNFELGNIFARQSDDSTGTIGGVTFTAAPLPGEVVVDGIDLVNGDADHAIECGGGTAVYDPDTQTLTLTNAEITIPSPGGRKAGIVIDGFTSPVTVKLVGENSITLTDTAHDNNGIWNDAEADLVISGAGSLDVLTYNDSCPFGIWTRYGSLRIEDAELSFALAEGSKSNGFLVDTNQDITVSNASITAEGYLQNLFTGSNMKLNDAEIDIVGGESVLYAEGNTSIEDSTVTATVTDTAAICVWGDLTITDSDVTAASVWDNGIYCYGKVTVSGGTAEITSEENDAFRANGGITITDNAEVEAEGYGAGVYTNEILSVESGSLTAKGENWAILARRISENGEGSKPIDDPAAIILGNGLIEASGAAIKTEDWVYTEVWDDWDWDYYDKWMSRSYFVDENAEPLTKATIIAGYTVTYSPGEDGTGDDVSDIKIPGVELTLKDAVFTRDNYTQTGWATTDGGEKVYDLKGSYTKDAEITLYPMWTANTYAVTLETNQGTIRGGDLTEYTYGVGAELPTAVTRPGYRFIGWYDNEDCEGDPVTEITTTDHGDKTFYAKWKKSSSSSSGPIYRPEIGDDCGRGRDCPIYGYTDLNLNAWYHDGIHFCLEEGLMNGISGNQFAPNGITTRAMIVTILWRLEGEPVVNYLMSFKDVPADMWYTEAIRWAASEGIVEGYGDTFGPNDPITREQMAAIMWRYAKHKGYDVSVGENTNILSYDDAFDVSDWAIPAMQWACGAGLINGIESGNGVYLKPADTTTRAQAAAILHRFSK